MKPGFRFVLSQELGLSFRCISASEPESQAREFMNSNFSARELPSHVFKTLAEQTQAADEPRPCTTHDTHCCTAGLLPQLAVLGTPCHPFSKMRMKRFIDGAAAHRSYETTFGDMKDFLTRFNPGTCVMEQVEGFDSPMRTGSPESPLDGFLGR